MMPLPRSCGHVNVLTKTWRRSTKTPYISMTSFQSTSIWSKNSCDDVLWKETDDIQEAQPGFRPQMTFEYQPHRQRLLVQSFLFCTVHCLITSQVHPRCKWNLSSSCFFNNETFKILPLEVKKQSWNRGKYFEGFILPNTQ